MSSPAQIHDANLEKMLAAAEQASALMKTLGNRHRLLILCQLANGERSVGELAETLEIAQSALSQHLARMRREGLVVTRREGQTIYYSLQGNEVERVIQCLYEIYCTDQE